MGPIELDVDHRFSGDVGPAGRHGQLDVVAQRPRTGWNPQLRGRGIGGATRIRRNRDVEARRHERDDGNDSPARNRPHETAGCQSGVTGAETRATQRAVSFSCTAFCRKRASSPGKSTSSSG